MSDWKKHNGGPCPVPPDTMVEVRLLGGSVFSGFAKEFVWRHDGDNGDITEYRLIEPAKEEAVQEVVSKTEIPTYEERLRDRVAIKALSGIIINEGCGGISTMEAQIKYALDMGEMYISQRAARKQKGGGM